MNKTTITTDVENKKVTVERVFAAPLKRVWTAWTDSSVLDQWWAPKPWKAVTHSFDFREGGHWHYYMSGPEGEKNWVWVDFFTIHPLESFTAEDFFCDAEGNRDSAIAGMYWLNEFHAEGESTRVVAIITFASTDDLNQIMAMGFEQGFSMGLDNLEELLAGK